MEIHMPTSIPVQVATLQFRSMNQARLYYTDILHKYPEGGAVDKQDTSLVHDLMTSSGSPYPTSRSKIHVSRGYFARKCFISVGDDKVPRYLSITKSLKRCIPPNVDSGSTT